MENLFSKEGFVSTILEKRTVLVRWELLFNAQAIYDSCQAQLKAVQEGKADSIILDISHAEGTPPMECQEWFGTTLFPAFSAVKGFKAIVNVLPEGAITKMGAKKWKKTAESGTFDFEFFETESVEIAKELLNSLSA